LGTPKNLEFNRTRQFGQPQLKLAMSFT